MRDCWRRGRVAPAPVGFRPDDHWPPDFPAALPAGSPDDSQAEPLQAWLEALVVRQRRPPKDEPESFAAVPAAESAVPDAATRFAALPQMEAVPVAASLSR